MRDSELEVLHDRVMVRDTEGTGGRRGTAGITIPATATVAKRLFWGEVSGIGHHDRTVKVGHQRELHAVAIERAEHGTGLYL